MRVRLRDLGFVVLCLALLWGCFLLRLRRYGQTHPDAFKQFLVDHQCYAAARKTDAMGRKYTEYKCQNDTDDVNLYDMAKGPGEK